jgi:PAS domain-containing protein
LKGHTTMTPTSDYNALIDEACISTLLCDVQGRIVQVTGTPELVFGFSGDSLHQQSILSAIPQVRHNDFVALFNEALKGNTSAAFAYDAPGPWGGTLLVVLYVQPLIAEGQLRGVMVQASERSLAAISEAVFGGNAQRGLELAKDAPSPIFFLDGRGQCTFMNDRWTSLTGQPALQALAVGFFSRLSESDAKAFRSTAVSAHINKVGWRLQFAVLTANGAPWNVDAAAASVTDANNTVIGYLGAVLPFSTKLSGTASVGASGPRGTTATGCGTFGARRVGAAAVTPRIGSATASGTTTSNPTASGTTKLGWCRYGHADTTGDTT